MRVTRRVPDLRHPKAAACEVPQQRRDPPFGTERARFKAIWNASALRDCRSSGERVMQETQYGMRVSVDAPYDVAVARATDALKEQGFGVLTTIDVQQTLKAKLNREFRKYIILGACNPPLADRALHAELEVGLLLPCNVIVYESGPSSSVVAAMAPLAALGIVGANPALAEVALEADARLRRALESLQTLRS
jgi:uncharacterized protein (DUF302 family)